ncbi:MAG: hypothetical protein ACTSRG_01545 [Candidatus Helarchaeota archaeon]
MKHVIIDTDIGGDPDDFIALLLALKSNVIIDLIVTSEDYKGYRANLVKTILELTDNEDIRIVRGNESTNYFFLMERKSDPNISTDHLEEIHKIVKEHEMIHYVGISSLTNLANF